MSERKWFVLKRIAVVVVVALLAVLVGSVLMVKATKSGPSDFERLALRMDAILDGLPEPKIEADPILLTYEIVPYFFYERLTSGPKYPSEIAFQLFGPHSANFHILGRAGCTRDGGGPAYINARGANPISPWYGEPWILPTIIHELIHLQGGGFCFGSSETLESTTQMATLEVLAAMANHGNKNAAYALIEELRDMAMGAVYYEALRDGEPERYFELRDKVYTNPLDKARSEKSKRFWNQDAQMRANLKDILNKYSFIPLGRALEGLADECTCIKNLYLGEWVEPGSYHGKPVDRFAARSLDVDDLAYFIDHVEEIAVSLVPPEE